MKRPQVEKYEAVLSQDPASTVFVELARAYLDGGENDRAVAICQQGLAYHPNSVAGRVLWGKALINAGKAADAMKQFDLAMNIDRENPHAYNLIGEALLRKGLYRSALPILRRAATLQPNNARVHQWLDQTKQALAGGPAPVLGDAPLTQEVQVPAVAAAPVPTVETPAAPDPFAAFAAPAPPDPDVQATVLMSVPGAVPSAKLRDERPTQEIPVTAEPPDPFASFGPSEPDVVHGLTSVFDALGNGTTAPPPAVAPPPSPPSGTEPSVVVGVELNEPPAPPVLQPVEPPPPAPAGLLDDVISTQSELPTSEFQLPGMIQEPLRRAERVSIPASSGGLLDDIPDEMMEPPQVVAPRTEMSTRATEAIAQEYERELRAKLEATKAQKTFWQRHGGKVLGGIGLAVVLMGLGGSFLYTRVKNRGETLDSAIARGLTAINADTKEQYGVAIEALAHALEMDDDSVEAAALFGYAKALVFAEHGGTTADRDAAIASFAKPAVRQGRDDLALVTDFLTADGAAKAAARQQLLGAGVEKAAVQAQAGRVYLADKKYDDALARLKKATELDPRNTRALVALGEYYLAFEDYESALDILSRAEAVSKFHPSRVIGQSEARLALGRENSEALDDLEGLPASAEIPAALKARYALALGRAQSANGKHEAALKTLTDAQPQHPQQALDFLLALGHAQRAAGQMAAAQKSFEDALKRDGGSEAVKEGLGRVLLARSREKELTDRLRPGKDARKVALLRGIAWYKLGDFKKARQELTATQVNGKYPAEAAIYLALTDAAEDGSGDKAIVALEKFSQNLKKNRAVVQVALARVYIQRGALDKARAQLEEAAKDPQDYEGNAMLGELLLKAGVPLEVAIEPLVTAIARNGSHAPSRHLLANAYLSLGKVTDAVAQVEAWVADNPGLDVAWRDTALVYLQAGRIKDAVAASAKVTEQKELTWWQTKADIEFAKGDGKAAMNALERANKLNPTDANTFCAIGSAFVRQGLLDNAGAGYGAALREDKKSLCAQGGPFFAKPAKGKAKDTLRSLVGKSEHAWEKGWLLSSLARGLLLENNVTEARGVVDEALGLAPFHPAVWFANGEVLRREKEDDKAIEAYGKAVEYDASYSAARQAYADALAKKGGDSLPLAVKQYEAFLTITQNEGDASRVQKTLAALKK